LWKVTNLNKNPKTILIILQVGRILLK
jgi:hypothetical protein